MIRQRRQRGGERFDALRERGHALLRLRVALTLAALRLRQRRLRLAERTLGALLRDGHVGPELEEVLLGGDTGGILHRRTAAQQQAGEEKG